MSAPTSTPEWASLLNDLLRCYWTLEQQALDQVAQAQRTQGQEPKETTFQPTQNSYGPVFRLNLFFSKRYGSTEGGYLIVVDSGEFSVCACGMLPAMESAALHALRDWLEPPFRFYYPPSATDQQKRQLDDQRDRLRRVVTDRLNDLESDKVVCDFGPLEGDDWNEVSRLARKLLSYMCRREQADLEQVFPAVWEKGYVAGKQDVSGVLNESNNFLAKRQAKRSLHKRRGEAEIFWA